MKSMLEGLDDMLRDIRQAGYGYTIHALADGTPVSVARHNPGGALIVSWGPGIRARVNDCQCDLMSHYARTVTQLIKIFGREQAADFEAYIRSLDPELARTREDRLLWRCPSDPDLANYLNSKYSIDTLKEGFIVGGKFRQRIGLLDGTLNEEYKTIVAVARKVASDFRLQLSRVSEIWVPYATVAQREHLKIFETLLFES